MYIVKIMYTNENSSTRLTVLQEDELLMLLGGNAPSFEEVDEPSTTNPDKCNKCDKCDKCYICF